MKIGGLAPASGGTCRAAELTWMLDMADQESVLFVITAPPRGNNTSCFLNPVPMTEVAVAGYVITLFTCVATVLNGLS